MITPEKPKKKRRRSKRRRRGGGKKASPPGLPSQSESALAAEQWPSSSMTINQGEQSGGGALENSSSSAIQAPEAPPTAARAASPVSFDDLPDAVLMRVVEILGTPPSRTHQTMGNHVMAPASFLSELSSMAQVYLRRRAAVRGHDNLWEGVCMWRWPWLSADEDFDAMESLVYRDPRHKAMAVGVDGEGQDGGGSLWLDLYMRTGRCLSKAGFGHKTDWRWQEDYVMMVELYTGRAGEVKRRLLLAMGFMSILPERAEGDKVRYKMTYGPEGEVGGDWGMTHAWPVEEVFGSSEEEWRHLVDEDGEIVLNMTVLLMDVQSGKMAMWYRNRMSLSPEPLLEARRQISWPPERCIVTPGVAYGVEYAPVLQVVQHEDQSRPYFSLAVLVPKWLPRWDFRCLLDELEWH